MQQSRGLHLSVVAQMHVHGVAHPVLLLLLLQAHLHLCSESQHQLQLYAPAQKCCPLHTVPLPLAFIGFATQQCRHGQDTVQRDCLQLRASISLFKLIDQAGLLHTQRQLQGWRDCT